MSYGRVGQVICVLSQIFDIKFEKAIKKEAKSYKICVKSHINAKFG